MKNLEKVAVALIILWVVATFSPIFIRLGAARWWLDTFQFREISTLASFISIGQAVLVMTVRIGIAIWLYILAKKGSETPWIWALFGLTFGLSGAILFFLIRVYYLLRENESIESNSS